MSGDMYIFSLSDDSAGYLTELLYLYQRSLWITVYRTLEIFSGNIAIYRSYIERITGIEFWSFDGYDTEHFVYFLGFLELESLH